MDMLTYSDTILEMMKYLQQETDWEVEIDANHIPMSYRFPWESLLHEELDKKQCRLDWIRLKFVERKGEELEQETIASVVSLQKAVVDVVGWTIPSEQQTRGDPMLLKER